MVAFVGEKQHAGGERDPRTTQILRGKTKLKKRNRILALLLALSSVSYTHLDVYKRQILACGREKPQLF